VSSSEPIRKEKIFVDRIIGWFQDHGRDYPWRRSREPYRILMAEVMLQRTKSDQVAPLYEKFLWKFPDPASLASAPPEEIQNFLEPLGLKWRARKVVDLGTALVKNFGGVVPGTREELITLPGVGEYAADAVLCYSHGKDLVPVDANVCRVLGRVFGLVARGEARRSAVYVQKAKDLPVSKGTTREFNWGLIDFAATICTPRRPMCPACPVNDICIYPNKTKA